MECQSQGAKNYRIADLARMVWEIGSSARRLGGRARKAARPRPARPWRRGWRRNSGSVSTGHTQQEGRSCHGNVMSKKGKREREREDGGRLFCTKPRHTDDVALGMCAFYTRVSDLMQGQSHPTQGQHARNRTFSTFKDSPLGHSPYLFIDLA